jgi:hypothetical protein
MAKENDAGTTAGLEVSGERAPGDPFIADVLRIFSHYEAGRISANMEKQKRR